jgi:ribosomal protein L44E
VRIPKARPVYRYDCIACPHSTTDFVAAKRHQLAHEAKDQDRSMRIVEVGEASAAQWKDDAKEGTGAHGSVIFTDLEVRCHDCGGHQIWRYLEDEDTIEVFHDCTGGKKGN